MKIDDLFQQLSYGELSNLAISNDGDGTIIEAKQPQLVGHINAGLTDLFTRFRLKIKEVIIEQFAHITLYPLKKQYAESVGTADYPFIKDSIYKPFQDDVIAILEVHDLAGEYVLNDKGNDASLYTPEPTTLQVSCPIEGNPLSIVYQANHPKLISDIGSIMGQDINIPYFLESALQSFVGYKIFSNMNGQENIVKGQEYLAAYEARCLAVEQSDLAKQTLHTTHCKLEQRGFV